MMIEDEFSTRIHGTYPLEDVARAQSVCIPRLTIRE